jgi:hypothetical protein
VAEDHPAVADPKGPYVRGTAAFDRVVFFSDAVFALGTVVNRWAPVHASTSS